MDRISIIIVNYNSGIFLKKCLKSIFEKEKNQDFEVIIVDNSSTDGSIDTIRQFPVKVMELTENIGFARANNLGLQICSSDLILMLNPDTEFIRENTLENLVSAYNKTENCRILAPALLYSDFTHQQSYFGNLPNLFNFLGQISGFNVLYRRTGILMKIFGSLTGHKEIRGIHEVKAVTGACIFTSREWLDKINLFDPEYFLFYEDLDLCKRTLDKGGKIFAMDSVKIIHHLGKSGAGSLFTYYHRLKSLLHYVKKHHNIFMYYFLKTMIFFNTLFRIFISSLTLRIFKQCATFKNILKLAF